MDDIKQGLEAYVHCEKDIWLLLARRLIYNNKCLVSIHALASILSSTQ